MAEPRSLEDLRARMNGGGIPQPEGPYPNAQREKAHLEPDGFDAGETWNFPYEFLPHADVRGHIPPPTQARIDKYQRAIARQQLKLVQALEKADEAMQTAEARVQEEQSGEEVEGGAEATSGLTDEEIDKQLDEAFAEKDKALAEFQKVIAEFCSGHPTLKQIQKLPENSLRNLNQAIQRALNPEG